jgi:hypothetical protein
MASDKDKGQQAQPKEDANDTVTVDLHNPTRGRRIIYDGINVKNGQGVVRQKAITVESGETVHNVVLHRDMVRELVEQNRRKQDSDLVPRPSGSVQEDEKTAA